MYLALDSHKRRDYKGDGYKIKSYFFIFSDVIQHIGDKH